ncbi:MAG: histidine phosphatase family protein [Bacteroidota bacterium]
MKTVVFCRHAKSDWPDGTSDIERPLKKRGVENAKDLGQLLAEQQFLPDRIISSPAKRALTTANIVSEKLGYQHEISIIPSIYHDGAGNLLSLVQDLDEKWDTVMFFGHNPTMENVVQYLLQSQKRYDMPTGGMACFESYAGWQQFVTTCQLRWLLVPRLRRKDE